MKFASAVLRSRYTTIAALWIITLLAFHWISVFVTHVGVTPWANLAAIFDLDQEWNIPTITNSFLLLINGIISLRLATKAKKRVQQLGWISSGFFFVYLAMDELFIIHEQLAEPIRKILNIGNSNPLYHAWVVPALVVILLLVIIILFIHAYYKQLRVFNGLLKRIVIMASGVVVLEIIGTMFYDKTLVYRLVMVPAEEIFELSMAAAILHYLAGQLNTPTRNENQKKIRKPAL